MIALALLFVLITTWTSPQVQRLPSPLEPAVEIAGSSERLDLLLKRLAPPGGRVEVGGEQPWQRVSVYAHGRPAGEVRKALATLLHYEWRDSGDGLAWLEPMAGLHGYEQRVHRETLLRGAAYLFRLTQFLATPEETWTALWKDQYAKPPKLQQPADPLVRHNAFVLGRSGPRSALEFLASLTPEQRFALLHDEELILDDTNMTERQGRMARNMGIDAGRLRERIHKLNEGESAEDSAEAAGKFGFILHVNVHPITGQTEDFDYGVGGPRMGAGEFAALPAIEPLLPVRGQPYGWRPAIKPAPYVPPAYPELEKLRLPADLRIDWAKDPAWRDVLAKLAEKLSLPIYSDDFRYIEDARNRSYTRLWDHVTDGWAEPPAPPELAGKPLAAALDALCRRFHYLWWYQDGALLFRSRTWFIEREYEYPPAVEELLCSRVPKLGRFDETSLDAFARLTRKQAMGLAKELGLKGRDRRKPDRLDVQWSMANNGQNVWRILQVFETFTPDQKRKALTDEGLPYAEMSPASNRAWLAMDYRRRGPAAINLAPKEVWQVHQGVRDDTGLALAGRRVFLSFTYREGSRTMAMAHLSVGYPEQPAESAKP